MFYFEENRMLSWIEAGLAPSAQQERQANWIGLSGHTYRLAVENLRDFVLEGSDLYMIIRGNAVLWVGCSNDLVADPQTRLRFRNALGRADGVLHLQRQASDDARLSTIADLEGAVPAPLHQAA
jgi:hypothetical protein